MRFSRPTHRLMCFFLETLTSIIWTDFSILVELTDLVNSVMIFSNDLTQMVNLLGYLTVILTFLLFWIYLFLLTLVFAPQRLSLHWKILMLLSQFPFAFHKIHNKMPGFIILLMTIVALTGMVFGVICEMFHRRISLNSVLLLLLVNFVSGFRLGLMYISLIENIKSSLIHLHGFQLLVLLP